MMKKLICMILLAAMTVSVGACGADDITDQVANVAQAEDEHVLAVKRGTPTAYPGKQYGEVFDEFFGSPTWKYFVGTEEGADEDGDGEPDYTEENVDIVEFTGYCIYRDVEVKALIQFTLSKEGDTFEATYLSFNDVPQNMLTLTGLLDAAFTSVNAEEDTVVEDNPAPVVQEEDSDQAEQEKNSDPVVHENDYTLLDEFISLICSYSDSPELEGEKLTEYYKGEYDAWLNGEGYKNIIKDSSGHLVIPNHAAEYTGTWQDTYSERCHMEITSSDGINYNIDINWGSSAWDNTHWSLYGSYDETAGGIHYYGSRIEEYYPDGGEMQETYAYTNGEGIIRMDDGMLYWDDYIEEQGAACSFKKVE